MRRLPSYFFDVFSICFFQTYLFGTSMAGMLSVGSRSKSASPPPPPEKSSS